MRHKSIRSRVASRRVALGILLCTMAGGGVAIAATTRGPSGAPETSAPALTPASVPAELGRAFAALRDPNARGALPERLRATMAVPGATPPGYGINLALAHSLPSSATEPLWLAPGSAGVCLVKGSSGVGEGALYLGSSGCTSIALALKTGLVMTTTAARGDRITVGVVPDSLHGTVSMREPDGSVRQVPDNQGAFVVHDRGEGSMTLTGTDGVPHIAVSAGQ